MTGDFSRITFDRKNHYIGVLEQQGRPRTDADANEAAAIATYRVETEAQDVVGRSGAPQENPGFGLSVGGSGALLISKGRFYVDGILVENDADVALMSQPHLPELPMPEQPSSSPLGLVYLDVFKRELSHHDRPAMRDPALHGVDTTTRLQTVWQVKVLPLDSVKLSSTALETLQLLAAQIEDLSTRIAEASDAALRAELVRQRELVRRELTRVAGQHGLSCSAVYPEWDAAAKAPTGTLQVSTAPVSAAETPCDVPPGGGYLRGENQFYRVRVHQVPANGSRNGATFLWSRDGGSVVTRIESVGSTTSGTASGAVFGVSSVNRDEYLGIFTNDWVEYTDATHELMGRPGVLARVTNADANLNRITLDRSLTVRLDQQPKLRKWDQTTGATDAGLSMNTSDAPIALEAGLQVQFSNGTYRPRDEWHFSARAVTASIDFPATPQLPYGVHHHYARLGFVLGTGKRAYVLLDCRDVFPPLTNIAASDVSFDNTHCNLPDALTVQDALEQLCARSGAGGTCTYSVSPRPGWWEVFSRIPQGGDAEICFAAGEYPVVEQVIVAGKGHLRLTGAGVGTRIRANTLESALLFRGCESVTVRDMAVQAGAVGEGDGLTGALGFENCRAVTLDSVVLRCASHVVRAASCLRFMHQSNVADLRSLNGLLTVQNCRFDIGNNQIGALVVNGARVSFHNNIFQCVDSRNASQRIATGLGSNPALRAEVRRTIFSDVEDGPTQISWRENISLNDRIFNIRSDPRLKSIKFFAQLPKLFAPTAVHDRVSATEYLQDAVDALLMKPATIKEFADYVKQMVTDDLEAFYQGIVIGGEEAEEVRLCDNTFVNALQGIHLGQSRAHQPPREILKSTVVTIEGNTIHSRITPAVNREAYGIFVGNCDSLYVHNNWLARRDLTSTKHLRMNGIHVDGQLGKRMIVRNNEAALYSHGIFVDPRTSSEQTLWIVAENASEVFATDERVQRYNNG